MVHSEYLRRHTLSTGPEKASHAQVIEYLIYRGGMKYAFGMPLDEAALAYKIPTNRGMYQVSDSRVGLHEAHSIRQLSERFTHANKAPVLSLFEGVGNTSWSLAQAFEPDRLTQIHAIELDDTIYRFATHNIAKAGLKKKVTIEQRDAYDVMGKIHRRQDRYRAIFLDPPWPENSYTADTMALDEVNPQLVDLVTRAVDCAPVVAFRVPAATTVSHIGVLGKTLKRGAYIQSHQIEGQDPKFTTKTVYLVKGPQDFTSTDLILPRGSTSEWIVAPRHFTPDQRGQ